MKYTVEFPLEAVRTAGDLQAIAKAVERLGFDALAFTEHPAPPKDWLESAPGHPTFDLVASLAFCAAVTESVRLMTFLIVLPYHRPFMIAKALATVDVLSGGRVTAVVGAGYLRGEFDALGVSFEGRNALLDDALSVLPEIWAGGPVTRSGAGYDAREIVSLPRPVQPGGPPLWIGGNGRAARERAATSGGWSPLLIGSDAASRLGTAPIADVTGLAGPIRDVRARAVQLRGDGAEVVVQVQTAHARVMHGPHSVAEHHDHLGGLADAGVDWFVVRVPGTEPVEVVDNLEYYASALKL